MHFASSLVLCLFTVGQVISYPTADSGVGLVEREGDCGDDSDAPDRLLRRAQCNQPVQCGPANNQQAYTVGQVKNAVKNLKSNLAKSTFAGDYPKPYGASDNSVIKALPSECIPSSGRRLYEWPILPAGYYNGGDPGADRVVVAATGEGTPAVSRVYCLTMTHRGATGNGFVPCIATTA